MKKEEIEEYLKSQVQEAKEKSNPNSFDANTSKKPTKIINEAEFMNTYTILDYIFPIHTFLDTKEALRELGTNYPCTFRYLYTKRYEFLHLLNQKYQKYLTDSERELLKSLEYKHFIYTFSSYLGSLIFLFAKPFKKLKIFRYYIAAYLFFPANTYSIFFLRKEFLPLKDKLIFEKPFNIEINDILDYTFIPDWRTYLYYYNYL
jgi:hypothetical protein